MDSMSLRKVAYSWFGQVLASFISKLSNNSFWTKIIKFPCKRLVFSKSLEEFPKIPIKISSWQLKPTLFSISGNPVVKSEPRVIDIQIRNVLFVLLLLVLELNGAVVNRLLLFRAPLFPCIWAAKSIHRKEHNRGGERGESKACWPLNNSIFSAPNDRFSMPTSSSNTQSEPQKDTDEMALITDVNLIENHVLTAF